VRSSQQYPIDNALIFDAERLPFMKHMKVVSRLASLGLALVLLVVVGFSLWSAIITQRLVNGASSSVHLSDLYDQTRYEVVVEESQVEQYRLHPAPATKAAFQNATMLLTRALLAASHSGEADELIAGRKQLALHSRYLQAITEMFAAIDAKNADGIERADSKSEPIFLQFKQLVNTSTGLHRKEALDSLAALNSVHHTTLVATPVVFGVGLVMIFVLLMVLRAYQRRMDEAMQAELTRFEHAALTDNLTNLGNHRTYQEDLQSTLASASDHGESLALAIIDIDELKLINETSGHLEGDRVLTAFAAILRDGHFFDCLYRLNGDEFAVILPHMTLCEATNAMEQLRHDAEQGLSGATVSIGIASALLDDCESEVLQEQAHLAVSEAKRRNHNTVVTYEDIRESVSLIAPAKVHALHRLLSERRVNVAFQPIWDIGQDRILAFEALTRPPVDYGFSGPQEAFDIAEKIGRAHELDYLCAHAILARAAELPADALLFLNLTPQTLDHDVLTGAILLEAVLSAGLTPGRVVLEITERSVVRLDVVVREAQKLRKLGFRLALDDTGAGNAGLEMLSQLAVDFVKIDRAIVVKALSDASARTILTGITTMARQMNSYVIAEGIEDVEMLNLVQEVGAQAVQGYLLGRPNQVLPSAHELQALRPSAQRASLDRLAVAL
jgi:diguanylate cyclase (GGDEF)-like protein